MALPALAIPGFLKAISPKVWKILGTIALVLFLIWFVNDKIKDFGDTRFKEGVAAEKAAWEEADRELQRRAAAARTAADRSAAVREAKHAAEVAEERKEIHEAIADGRSPLDVLFGG